MNVAAIALLLSCGATIHGQARPSSMPATSPATSQPAIICFERAKETLSALEVRAPVESSDQLLLRFPKVDKRMLVDPKRLPTDFACYLYDPALQNVRPVDDAVWQSATGQIVEPGGRAGGVDVGATAAKATNPPGEVIDSVESHDGRFVAVLVVTEAHSIDSGWLPQGLAVTLPYECQLYRASGASPCGKRIRLPINDARGQLVGGWTADDRYVIYKSPWSNNTVCICPLAELRGDK